MALSRARIVEAAYATLREHGLAGVSMRSLARDLGVQAGALYYHVASKQDLLAAVAERVLADSAQVTPTTEPTEAARNIRDTLLRVRDSAEVISFVHVFRPETLAPFRALPGLFSTRLPEHQAQLAAHTLISYILGFVAEEQNYAELVRAKIMNARRSETQAGNAFRFGVDTILRGLGA